MAEDLSAEDLQREFGRRVKRRRMMLGLNQVQLAGRSGIKQEHISRMERGKYRAMNLLTLVKLAECLETSLDFLLARSDEAGPIPFREESRRVA
jgi:transcriptional regulator with XRE-family HTH domain